MQTITQIAAIALGASAVSLQNLVEDNIHTPKFLDCGIDREACIEDGALVENMENENLSSRHPSKNDNELFNFAQTQAWIDCGMPFRTYYCPTHEQLLFLADPIWTTFSTDGAMSLK